MTLLKNSIVVFGAWYKRRKKTLFEPENSFYNANYYSWEFRPIRNFEINFSNFEI
jgi:hypothetical protein